MLDKPTLATNVGAGLAVGTSAATSLNNSQSLLNSDIPQILAGDFTLYGSDIATVMGLTLSVIGIALTVYRLKIAHKEKKDAANALQQAH